MAFRVGASLATAAEALIFNYFVKWIQNHYWKFNSIIDPYPWITQFSSQFCETSAFKVDLCIEMLFDLPWPTTPISRLTPISTHIKRFPLLNHLISIIKITKLSHITLYTTVFHICPKFNTIQILSAHFSVSVPLDEPSRKTEPQCEHAWRSFYNLYAPFASSICSCTRSTAPTVPVFPLESPNCSPR